MEITRNDKPWRGLLPISLEGHYLQGSCSTCRLLTRMNILWTASIDLSALHRTSLNCKICSFILHAVKFFHPGALLNSGSGQYTSLKIVSTYGHGNLHVNYEPSPGPIDIFEPRLVFYAEIASRGPENTPWQLLPSGEFTRPRHVFERSCWKRQVRQWISRCLANHASCPRDKKRKLPWRYLGITAAGNEAPSIRLLENKADRAGRYVALSHVWKASMNNPGPSTVNTTKANIKSRIKGMNYADLPKTFQQAIQICIKLGIKFLWIDSLCIIQDDKLDWKTQAARMGEYYQDAYLTIAAHPTHTVFGDMDTVADNGCHLDRPGRFKTRIRGSNNSFLDIFAQNTHDHEQFTSSLHSCSTYFQRGWCFQERILAPRILHFTRSEIVYECLTGIECECGRIKQPTSGDPVRDNPLKSPLAKAVESAKNLPPPPPQHHHLSPPDAPRDQAMAAYGRLIADYSQKDLTQCTDLFPALSGVSGLLSPLLGTNHAGIWEYNLHLGLQWTSDWQWKVNGECRRYPDGTYIAPSWSWASRRGGCFPHFVPITAAHRAECPEDWNYAPAHVRCEYSRDGGDLVGGSLTLRTSAVPAAYEGSHLWGRARLLGEGLEYGSCEFVLDALEDQHLAETRPIVCIELKQSKASWQGVPRDYIWHKRLGERMVQAMAIVAVPSDRRVGAFQRIGFAVYNRPARELSADEFVIV